MTSRLPQDLPLQWLHLKDVGVCQDYNWMPAEADVVEAALPETMGMAFSRAHPMGRITKGSDSALPTLETMRQLCLPAGETTASRSSGLWSR